MFIATVKKKTIECAFMIRRSLGWSRTRQNEIMITFMNGVNGARNYSMIQGYHIALHNIRFTEKSYICNTLHHTGRCLLALPMLFWRLCFTAIIRNNSQYDHTSLLPSFLLNIQMIDQFTLVEGITKAR